MKSKIYTIIHRIPNIFLPKTSESRRFFAFFITCAVFELILSKLVLLLSEKGLYDLYTALRIAPVMAKSALLALVLAFLCTSILDLNLQNKENDS